MGYIELKSIYVEVRQHRTNYYIVSFAILEILQWPIIIKMFQEVSNWEYTSQHFCKAFDTSEVLVHFLHAATISFNHFMLIRHSIQRVNNRIHNQSHFKPQPQMNFFFHNFRRNESSCN